MPEHILAALFLVTKSLVQIVLDQRERRWTRHVNPTLAGRTLGILGMAFKGESDDPRASLSYKLRKLAQFKGANVMCTDPYVADPTFEPLDKVLRASDVIVLGAPHRAYRDLELDGREVVDIWGITGPIRL